MCAYFSLKHSLLQGLLEQFFQLFIGQSIIIMPSLSTKPLTKLFGVITETKGRPWCNRLRVTNCTCVQTLAKK